jgi:4-hydroxybenzoate polyprenyltransferase
MFPLFIIWGLSWLSIATAYSTKPFRLKERGKIGLIFVVIAQRVLPVLIVFSAFNHYNWLDCIVLTIYIFFRGLSSDLNHQIEDIDIDLATNTGTYAVAEGHKKAQKIFRFSLEMEKTLLILCLFVILFKLNQIKFLGYSFILPILVFYLLLYGASWLKIKAQGEDKDVNPFVSGRKDIFQFIHHTFPSVILPFYLLLFLVYNSWQFIIILLFFIMLRKIYSIELLKNSFIGNSISILKSLK